jgi:subtilase family serine protease
MCVSDSQWAGPFVGRLPATQSIRIDIVLPVREGLDSFLHELYNPSSPSFRQFLTVEQFTEKGSDPASRISTP